MLLLSQIYPGLGFFYRFGITMKSYPALMIYHQDLAPLCESLEGRSNNPVALLFDSLFHPEADWGADVPSALEWRHEEMYEIPHVVLGKTRPGGTWQVQCVRSL